MQRNINDVGLLIICTICGLGLGLAYRSYLNVPEAYNSKNGVISNTNSRHLLKTKEINCNPLV